MIMFSGVTGYVRLPVIKTRSAECGVRSADTQTEDSQNADTQNADDQKMIEKINK